MEARIVRCTLTTALVALALGAGYFAVREMTVAAQGQRVLEIRTYVTPDKTGLDNLVTRMRSEQKDLRPARYEERDVLDGHRGAGLRKHLRLHPVARESRDRERELERVRQGRRVGRVAQDGSADRTDQDHVAVRDPH